VSREVRDAKDAAISRNGNFRLTNKKYFKNLQWKLTSEVRFLNHFKSKLGQIKKEKKSRPNLLVNNFLVLNLCANKYLI